MASSVGLRLVSRLGLRLCSSGGLTSTSNAAASSPVLNLTPVRSLRHGSAFGPSFGRKGSFHVSDVAFNNGGGGQDVMDVIEQEEEQKTKETMAEVNAQINDKSYGRLFAVVQMEWHQHKITSGDLLMLNYDIGAPNGTRLRLDKALLVGSKDFTLMGRPLLPRDLISITATVVEKTLSHTKVTFIHKRKERAKKHSYRFHRQFNTTLRINSIDLLKPVDQTVDRSGFEPMFNTDPLAPLDPKSR